LTDARTVAVEIAMAVGETAQRDGLAPKTTRDALRRRVIDAQWTPHYASIEV
jgi:malic enzyme